MADKRHHDWSKVQPHRADNGRFPTRKYAEEHPEKVEWVKEKK